MVKPGYPVKMVGEICEKYNAIFHSDTVQTMGHYQMDLQDIKVHFITCAAHKFHGPKGVGFLYVNGNIKINPLIYGGAQERNMRGGTENLYGIIGLGKALEIAMEEVAHRPTPVSYDLLAWSYYNLGEKEKALQIAQKYVAGKSFEPKLNYHLAVIYKANNKLDKVKPIKEELLKSTFELGPNLEKKIIVL